MKKIKPRKIIKFSLLAVLVFLAIIVCYFFIGTPKRAEKITWGMNFSQKHTENFGLDWKEVYIAFLDDMGADHLKISTHWDLIEPVEGRYNFDDLDWQIGMAKERSVKLILVIGMKTPRWPECHLAGYAWGLDKNFQQDRIMKLLEKIVLRYKDEPSIIAWQVENEPLFPFGTCPWTDKDFLKKEIAFVKELDGQKRPVIISDSGESSLWVSAAGLGDIVSATLHRKVWFKEVGVYVSYPFKPVYYWRKAQIVKNLFGKEVICSELQAEPWCPTLLYSCSLDEQEKTMNLERFENNIAFAEKTGLDEFYLWGGEWMYWLKETQGQPEIWMRAKKLWQQ